MDRRIILTEFTSLDLMNLEYAVDWDSPVNMTDLNMSTLSRYFDGSTTLQCYGVSIRSFKQHRNPARTLLVNMRRRLNKHMLRFGFIKLLTDQMSDFFWPN